MSNIIRRILRVMYVPYQYHHVVINKYTKREAIFFLKKINLFVDKSKSFHAKFVNKCG